MSNIQYLVLLSVIFVATSIASPDDRAALGSLIGGALLGIAFGKWIGWI